MRTGGTGQPEIPRGRPDLAALYLKHRRLTYNAVFGVLGPDRQHQVEDVVQDMWIKVWRHLSNPTATDPTNWEAWLRTIAVRCALTQLKKDRTYDKYVEDYGQATAPRPPTERPETQRPLRTEQDPVAHEAIASQDAQRLRALLDVLPRDERTMVYLKFFEGLSNEEVQSHLITPRTARSVGHVLNRVLHKLAVELGGQRP